MEKLQAAIKIAREWQDQVKSGTFSGVEKWWGYSAFAKESPVELAKSLAARSEPLGKLIYSELQEDRCLVDLDGGTDAAKGTYITLRWLSEYEKGLRRDNLILHEPKHGSKGLKIIGLRRERLGAGRQGAFEMAASLGQLALLKLHGAPRERWEPYQREARALAARLKLELPPIPDEVDEADKASGEKLVSFVMTGLGPVLEKAGEDGGSAEMQTALTAFAILMLYTPGEETSTRLAVLMGSSAERAKLPDALWKPIVKAVAGKEPLVVVHENVQSMIAGVAHHLQQVETAEAVASGAREILRAAYANMAQLETYEAQAEMNAEDGRKSIMTASLAPGAVDLTLQGFDGRTERRVAYSAGFFVSSDNGKTWRRDADRATTEGLCRTLQAPVDALAKIATDDEFIFKAMDIINDEELLRFESKAKEGEMPRAYWILMSKAGPVVRIARLPQVFGELKTDALFSYTRLGKEVQIAQPVAE